MLIINADDLGRDNEATDCALACHAQHRVTSTSAMVFMRDSERAAELATLSGIDVGLHINVSERFTGANVPPRVRDAQGRLCRYLNSSKYSLILYHPSLRQAFRLAYEAQFNEFLRLYHNRPTHFDGHQHMHLATNMLVQRLIPAGTRVRRNFSFCRGEKSIFNLGYRRAVDSWLSRRHRLTDYFFSLSEFQSVQRLATLVRLATEKNVELMTHPCVPNEFAFLMSDDYAACVGTAQLAVFENLS